MMKIDGFDTAAYRRRLRIMREIVSGLNQIEFADSIGINHKRWSNYERGYPIPREAAWVLWAKYQIDPAWLWWGKDGNMPKGFTEKVRAVEQAIREEEKAASLLAKARQRHARAQKLRQTASRKRGLRGSQPRELVGE